MDRKQPNRLKKYRSKMDNDGFERLEFYIRTNYKAQFEALAQATADELVEPFDARQRVRLAKTRLFEEMMQKTTHEFFTLKDRIKVLEEEVAALAPAFFKTTDKTPLPEAIRALPNEPDTLKAILAKVYQEAQQAKLDKREYKRRAEQYLKLYEVVSEQNVKLEQQLNQHRAQDTIEID